MSSMNIRSDGKTVNLQENYGRVFRISDFDGVTPVSMMTLMLPLRRS
jgi:hypothetical protein